MRLSRRSLLGSFLALPFFSRLGSGTTLKPRKVNDLLTINGSKVLARNFECITDIWPRDRETPASTATFHAPFGSYKLGQDISVRWNGQELFTGIVQRIKHEFTGIEVVAVDRQTLMEGREYV